MPSTVVAALLPCRWHGGTADVCDRLQHFRLTCLTPVHIGSGIEYVSGIDFIVRNGKTFILNSERVLQRLSDIGQLARDLDTLRSKIRDLFQGKKAEEYVWTHAAATVPEGVKTRALLRSALGNPLIPGSSLKGALRTLIFAGRAGNGGPHQPMSPELERKFKAAARQAHTRSKNAALDLEQALFRQQARLHRNDAKADLMRACSVADVVFAMDCATIVLTKATGTQTNTLTAVEALAAGSAAAATIRLGDRYLESELFTDNLPSWERISQWSREHSRFLLRGDLQYFQDIGANLTARLERLEQQIKQATPQTIFLRLGWGTGWRSMTGDLLPHGQERQRLLPKSSARGPKTRKVIVAGSNHEPSDILGWVSLQPISAETAGELNRAVQPAAPAPPEAPASNPIAVSFPEDLFIQGLSHLRPADWGSLAHLYAQAQQDEKRRGTRLEGLARRISEVWGHDKKRLAEARAKFPELEPYWKKS